MIDALNWRNIMFSNQVHKNFRASINLFLSNFSGSVASVETGESGV